MLETLSALLPDIQNTHKKTSPEIRINALNEFSKQVNCANFKEIEPNLVQDFFPILFKRLDDKPTVVEEKPVEIEPKQKNDTRIRFIELKTKTRKTKSFTEGLFSLL